MVDRREHRAAEAAEERDRLVADQAEVDLDALRLVLPDPEDASGPTSIGRALLAEEVP